MPYNVRFKADESLVYTAVSGPLDADYATEFTTEAAEIAEKNNCQKFLFDIRDTVLIELAAGILEYVSNLESMGFKKSYKSAVVYVSDEKNLKFLESSAQKQGFNIHLFTDLGHALTWLNKS